MAQVPTATTAVAFGVSLERDPRYADEQSRLHATWSRTNPTHGMHTLLHVEGKGQYVGNIFQMHTNYAGWWGEGEIKFYMDGDTNYPTICGTGTEDYFCGSYDFDTSDASGKTHYTEFSTPYSGLAQVIRPDGLYDSQKPAYATQGPTSRARFITDNDGRFYFRTILPTSYPVPTDGPVGEMIMQTKRHPMRPAHVHFLVNAKGYEPLITHVFIDGDKYLDSDVVFGVKDELIAKIEKRSDKTMPDGKPAAAPWHLMTYEFHMKPGGGAAPKPMAAKATEDA